MDNIGLIIIFVLLAVGVGALFYLYRYRTRNLNKMFEQVFEAMKPIPKQKKNTFLLLMFKDSVKTSKNKSKTKVPSTLEKSISPKQLDIQLIQMGTILKDRSKVTDKNMKKALSLFDSYLTWEKNKNGQKKIK